MRLDFARPSLSAWVSKEDGGAGLEGEGKPLYRSSPCLTS